MVGTYVLSYMTTPQVVYFALCYIPDYCNIPFSNPKEYSNIIQFCIIVLGYWVKCLFRQNIGNELLIKHFVPHYSQSSNIEKYSNWDT